MRIRRASAQAAVTTAASWGVTVILNVVSNSGRGITSARASVLDDVVFAAMVAATFAIVLCLILCLDCLRRR